MSNQGQIDQRHAQRYAAAARAAAMERARQVRSASIIESGPDLRAGARKLSFGIALAAVVAAIVGAVSMATGNDFGLRLPAFDPSTFRWDINLPDASQRTEATDSSPTEVAPDAGLRGTAPILPPEAGDEKPPEGGAEPSKG